ncbi:MAG: hypothetical protein P4L72_07345 [Parvibaculum sp.]|jgi:hypothetical protein|uniref:hypothetical protein n=1 Tax=Parvibaculum sp. TaxID=2024848 RepID=UPI00284E34E6|nr:hypothetical protein [Parvibaculum sp.]MDR3499025.1 hypothetical protein [Parvibaculum sp.]
MGWIESRVSFSYLMAVALLAFGLGGCASLTSGSSGTVDTNAILLQKAQDRAAVAQRSVKEATDMIAEGEKQRADGQKMIDDGQRKVETGRELKAAADIELVRAQKQVAAQQAQMPQSQASQASQ